MIALNLRISKCLANSQSELRQSGVAEPEREALLILSHILKIKPGKVLTISSGFDSTLEREADAILKKRCRTRKPLAYIIGECEFFGLDFMIDENVLIPRQETEILVGTVLEALPDESLIGIDVGTGSGIIAISLLSKRSKWKIIGVDISEPALRIAQKNALLHNVQDRFLPIRCDALSPLIRADFVVCNPPYIPHKEIHNLSPEVRCEPISALDGGEDGFEFINKFVRQGTFLRSSKLIAFEFGWGQSAEIEKMLLEQKLNFEIINDLAEIPRVALIYFT